MKHANIVITKINNGYLVATGYGSHDFAGTKEDTIELVTSKLDNLVSGDDILSDSSIGAPRLLSNGL